MKPTEIEKQILKILNNTLLDDLYATSVDALVKAKFFELAKINTEDEIRPFLQSKFPETNLDMVNFNLKNNTVEFQEKNRVLQEEVIVSEGIIEKTKGIIADKKNNLIQNQEFQENLQLKIVEIDLEIKVIEPLSTKQPYSKQFADLKNERITFEDKIKTLFEKTEKTNGEILDLNNTLTIQTKNISTNKKEIKANNVKIESFTIDSEKTIKETNFEKEFAALAFLYNLFLQEKISIYKERITVIEKVVSNWQTTEREVWKETGKIILDENKIYDEKLYQPLIISKVKQQKSMPVSWRNILLEILQKPLPNLSGFLERQTKNTDVGFFRKKISLSAIDISTFLALKIALKHNYSVKTAQNEIILGLSSGVMAKIIFREKGGIVKNFQKDEIEIYANIINTSQYILQSLYFQTGYADCKIQIQTPNSYVILAKDNVIEICFEPAPMLFDNSNLVKFAPNISAIAKEEDDKEDDDD